MNPTKGNHQLNSQEKLIMQRVKLKLISKNEKLKLVILKNLRYLFPIIFFKFCQ